MSLAKKVVLCFLATGSGSRLRDLGAGGSLDGNASSFNMSVEDMRMDVQEMNAKIDATAADLKELKLKRDLVVMARFLKKAGEAQNRSALYFEEAARRAASHLVADSMAYVRQYGLPESDAKRLADDLARNTEDSAQKIREEHLRKYKIRMLEACLGPAKVIVQALKCPMSGDLLWDPVTDGSGYTFERKWVRSSEDLRPNRAIKGFLDRLDQECPQARLRAVVGSPPQNPGSGSNGVGGSDPVPRWDQDIMKAQLGLARTLTDLWCCPVSLGLPRKPVILPSGYTYDEGLLEEWLLKQDVHMRREPVTKAKVEDKDLVPNRLLNQVLRLMGTTVRITSGPDGVQVTLGGRRVQPRLSEQAQGQPSPRPFTRSGLHVFVVDPAVCAVVSTTNLDVDRRQDSNEGELKALLASVPVGHPVLAAYKRTDSDVRINFASDEMEALRSVGAKRVSSVGGKENYLLVGIKGDHALVDVEATGNIIREATLPCFK